MSTVDLLNKLNLRTMSLEMRGTGKATLSWEHISAALAGLSKEAYDFALANYQQDNNSTRALLAWLSRWIGCYMQNNGIQAKAQNMAESIAFVVLYQYIVKSRACKSCKGIGVVSKSGKLVQCHVCDGIGYHGASTEDKLKLGKISISRQCYERKYKAIEQVATSELLHLDNIVLNHLVQHLFDQQNSFSECA